MKKKKKKSAQIPIPGRVIKGEKSNMRKNVRGEPRGLLQSLADDKTMPSEEVKVG